MRLERTRYVVLTLVVLLRYLRVSRGFGFGLGLEPSRRPRDRRPCRSPNLYRRFQPSKRISIAQ